MQAGDSKLSFETRWSKTTSMKGHITVWGKICGPQRTPLPWKTGLQF